MNKEKIVDDKDFNKNKTKFKEFKCTVKEDFLKVIGKYQVAK